MKRIKINENDSDAQVALLKDLVYTVRGSKDKKKVNFAFNMISEMLEVKMKKIAGKFKIPGFSFEDIYQECLCALLNKAIKDYDENRGADPTKTAPFDRFALLCIRRHLATTLKTAHQNKKKILNESKSLDQDRSNDNNELALINIIYSSDSDVLTALQDKENFRTLINKLLSKLSPFEKQVFILYAHQYTYEEIAQIINANLKGARRVQIKAIDNALSRLKQKGKQIITGGK